MAESTLQLHVTKVPQGILGRRDTDVALFRGEKAVLTHDVGSRAT